MFQIGSPVHQGSGCDCLCIHKRSPDLSSGVFRITLTGVGSISVYCDMETDGGGWTVFQRRKEGSVDFYRGWTDYENGFGNLRDDYWMGLARLYKLLQFNGENELRVDLKNYAGNSAYAKYSSFFVGSSSSKYRLSVSGYSGTAGDSLTSSNGMQFSTKDQDNDAHVGGHCASARRAGWWFGSCGYSSLNGLFQSGTSGRYINWYHFPRSWASLLFSEMKFRKA